MRETSRACGCRFVSDILPWSRAASPLSENSLHDCCICRETLAKNRLVKRIESAERAWVLKVHRFRTFGALRRRFKRTNPALRAGPLAEEARRRGVYVPAVLAAGSVFVRGRLFGSFTALEAFDSLVPLDDYLRRRLVENCDLTLEEARRLVARGLSSAHRRGFFHGDIKAYHVLVDPAQEDSEWRWIDLDDCKVVSPARGGLTFPQRTKNLYQLWRYVLEPLGETEPSRFIAEYKSAAAASFDELEMEHAVKAHYARRLARRRAPSKS